MKKGFTGAGAGRQAERSRGFAATALVAISMAAPIAFSGCAGSKGAVPAARQGQRSEAPASSDLLLAEALRLHVINRDTAQAMAMAQLAVKRSPERPDALWILLQICNGAPGCQPEPLEAQLRTLDPTNGIVWLGALSRANQRRDQAAADQILEAIARSQRVDLGWNGIVGKLSLAVSERTRKATPANKAPLADALNEIVGLLSSVALPALQPVSDSCSERRLIDKLVSARCLLVSAILQRSDTYAAESIGLGIAQRLAVTDSVETVKVERHIATARYQRDVAGEIMSTQVEKERFANELLELMNKQRREQDVFIAVIRWSGRPLTPSR